MRLIQSRAGAVRPGAALVLVTILLIVIVGMVAFAVDIGWILLVRNQLQTAADSAALAGASKLYDGIDEARAGAMLFGGQNNAGGSGAVTIADGDVAIGYWDAGTRTFTAGASPANAVKVTTRRTANLFFGGIFGMRQKDIEAEAIAMANPRDIAFVVDLSGSMNNDSEIWATDAINSTFTDYPTVGTDLMQAVFNDFGYGAYPGTVRHIGEGFIPGRELDTGAYDYLANTYLYNNVSYTTKYRTTSSDNSTTRKTKVYRWIIDYQLASIMPNALPAPNSDSNLAYWSVYLDYVISGGSRPPPGQSSYRITTGSNPYPDAWPSLGSSAISGFANKVGYQTYVEFMMDYGYNRQAAGQYVPLSRHSPFCPWRQETDPTSPGFGLSFPPREQPTHAARMAVMAAIDKIALVNVHLPEAAKDHVCVITFDTAGGVAIRYPLDKTSCDYAAAKASARDLQAVADDQNSTASENGIIAARNHLNPVLNPDGARPSANKVLVFLTDGIPNIKQTSNSTIDAFADANPKGEWFTGGSYFRERNATLMQTMQLKGSGWKTYGVGIGLGTDRTLMDRLARTAGTALRDPNNPDGPKISPFAGGNPANYEERLKAIFSDIVAAPYVTLVK
jgi:hypothetical protein